MRVRGLNPFQPTNPDVCDGGWQDWVYSDGVFDGSSGSFKQDSPPNNEHTDNDNLSTQSQFLFNLMATNPNGTSPGGRRVVLNEGVIADIFAATRASPSWKACQMESTSWTGTAEEKIQKYTYAVSVQNDNSPPSSVEAASTRRDTQRDDEDI